MNPVRRVKSYSGESGVVYRYVFRSQRRARRGWWTRGSEYLFDVSSDRKNSYTVAIFIADQALSAWQKSHGRALSSTEQYAAAKMRLFRAFDQVERLDRQATAITVDPGNIDELLSTLDIS